MLILHICAQLFQILHAWMCSKLNTCIANIFSFCPFSSLNDLDLWASELFLLTVNLCYNTKWFQNISMDNKVENGRHCKHFLSTETTNRVPACLSSASCQCTYLFFLSGFMDNAPIFLFFFLVLWTMFLCCYYHRVDLVEKSAWSNSNFPLCTRHWFTHLDDYRL